MITMNINKSDARKPERQIINVVVKKKRQDITARCMKLVCYKLMNIEEETHMEDHSYIPRKAQGIQNSLKFKRCFKI